LNGFYLLSFIIKYFTPSLPSIIEKKMGDQKISTFVIVGILIFSLVILSGCTEDLELMEIENVEESDDTLEIEVILRNEKEDPLMVTAGQFWVITESGERSDAIFVEQDLEDESRYEVLFEVDETAETLKFKESFMDQDTGDSYEGEIRSRDIPEY